NVFASPEAPQDGCTECGLVEFDGGVPVTDGEHGGNLRRYHRGPGNGGSPLIRAHIAGMPREEPMVAGEILGSIPTLAIHSFMQIFDNPSARGFRSLEMGVHILKEHGQVLSSVSELRWSGAARPSSLQHDPRLAEKHLCSADRAAGF